MQRVKNKEKSVDRVKQELDGEGETQTERERKRKRERERECECAGQLSVELEFDCWYC